MDIDNADTPNPMLGSSSSMEIIEQNRSKDSGEVGDGGFQMFSSSAKDF